MGGTFGGLRPIAPASGPAAVAFRLRLARRSTAGEPLDFLALFSSVVARTGSIAIATDRIHYTSDLMLNAAVIGALLLENTAGFIGADALFGIAIALWLLFGAWRASAAAIAHVWVVLTALVVIGPVSSPSPLIQTCGVSDSTSS